MSKKVVPIKGEFERPQPQNWVKGVALAGLVSLYVPLAAMVLYSFLDRSSGEPQWTIRWYQEAFSDSVLNEALVVSLWVGLWSTLAATVMGTAAAMALHKYDFWGKRLLDLLILVPVVMPCLVMGLSLLIWFVFLKITLGIFSITLAHITFSISYVVFTVRTRLAEFDQNLESAARDLGANSWQVFWRVTFPLILPGILSGALMAFTLSFDDFIVSFFTAGVGSDTLPMKIYSMIKFGISPKVNALSTLILLATIVAVLLAFPPKLSRAKK